MEKIINNQYNEAYLVSTARSEKYDNEVIRGFSIIIPDIKQQFNIKRSIMIEIAETYNEEKKVNNLIRNGWKNSSSSGTGLALKGLSKEEWIEFTMFESKKGEDFNTNNIEAKHLFKLPKDPLESLFKYLTYDQENQEKKLEAAKKQRTSLQL